MAEQIDVLGSEHFALDKALWEKLRVLGYSHNI